MINETALMNILREMHGVLTDMTTIQAAMLARIVELEERMDEAEQVTQLHKKLGEKQ